MEYMSEQTNEIFTALSKAQRQMANATKDKLNPHYKSRYADLTAYLDAAREPLTANNLALTQTMRAEGTQMFLITRLCHSSGQWVASEMPVIASKLDPQGIGSALSYYRRYCLAAICGMGADDDDAETAQQPYRQPPKPKYLTQEQARELNTICKSMPDDRQERFWTYCKENFNAQDWVDIPSEQFENLKRIMTMKPADKAA